MIEYPTIEKTPAAEYLAGIPKLHDPLIVMGDAPGHWKELEEALEVLLGADIMSINGAAKGNKTIINIKGFNIKYVATLHSANFGKEGHSYPASKGIIPKGAEVHGLNVNGVESEYVDRVWRVEPCGGTSALFGVIVGLILGYDRVMTVGVHLNTYRYWDVNIDRIWSETWYPVFKPCVRGWSGLPKDIYGKEF